MIKKYLNKLSRILIATLLLFTFIPIVSPTFAQSVPDFEFNSDLQVDYTRGNDYVKVSQILEIKVNNDDYLYPAQDSQTFTIPSFSLMAEDSEKDFKRNSLNVFEGLSSQKEFTVEDNGNGFDVIVENIREIKAGNPYKITISYNTRELVNENGNVLNFYLPGLSKESKFRDERDGLVTAYSYKGSINLPPELDQISYVRPEQYSKVLQDGKINISFSQDERIGKTGWVQVGNQQFYEFKIVQKTPKTDNLTPEQLNKITNLVSTNLYRISLPREFDEIDQKVQFKKITPEPKKIERDNEGNISAYFEMPANRDSEIVIEGYISMQNSLTKNEDALSKIDLPISEYVNKVKSEDFLSKYLQPGKFWETDSETVTSISSELLNGETNLKSLILKDYNYIVDQFDYSEEKISSGNERVGAKAALEGAAAVCMEYSDSLVAILRAQGIPARIAIGYGNDPTGAANIISNDELLAQRVGHQWLQIWVPDYGWLSIDPTWGESDRTYIGGDLDHILFYTFGDTAGDKYVTSLSSADNILGVDLETYTVYLQALSADKLPDLSTMASANELVGEYANVSFNDAEAFLKTTTLGRSLIYIVPIISILVIVSIVVAIFAKITKSIRMKS